jgi:hypothetical protein
VSPRTSSPNPILVVAFALLVCSCLSIQSATVQLTWYPLTPSNNVSGYKVHYGSTSRAYTTVSDVGNVTTASVTGLNLSQTYYFAITAYSNGEESAYSDEMVWDKTPPFFSGPTGLVVTVDASGHASIPNLTSTIQVSDNFSVATNILIAQNPASDTPVSAGTTLVLLTATDEAGNVAHRSVAITMEVIVNNADPVGVEKTGVWTSSAYTPGYWRTNYLHDANTAKGTKGVTFRPMLPMNGKYAVYMWWPQQQSYQWASNVPVDIADAKGTNTVIVSQATNGNQWVLLGTNDFVAGANGWVKIRTDGTTNGYVIADSVRFLKVETGRFGRPPSMPAGVVNPSR